MNTNALRQKILDLAIHGKLVDSAVVEPVETTRQSRQGNCHTDSKFLRNSISKDEQPFELPQGWKWVKLGEICDYGKCKNVDSSELKPDDWILDLEDIEKDSGKILEYHTFEEKKSESTKHKFSKGQVLYSKLRPYLNKVVIAPKDGFCTSEILPLDFKGVMKNKFAQFLLMSPYFLSTVNMLTYGVKMPRLGTSDAIKILIPLPPLAEQKLIVAKIEQIFAQIDFLEQNKNDLRDAVRQAKSKILDLAIHGKLVDSGKLSVDSEQTEPSPTKNGYVHHLRIKLLEKLKPQLGKIKNIKTGIVANLSKKSVDKMTSAKALEKSKNNGFTINEHFEIAEQIKTLYENADLVYEHGNLKNPDDVNVVSIKRFVIGTSLKSGTAVDVLITVKESLANGNKIYSIELDEINKASERFRGLSDAAEKSADRATKTPHVDNSNITQKAEKSSDNRPRHAERYAPQYAPAFVDDSASVHKDEEPFELPQGWKWVRLGEICDFIGGGTPSKSNADYWNGNINWASVKDIKGEYLYETEDKITEDGVKNSSTSLAKKGDLILVTRISPGKAIISQIDTAINQDLKIVVPKIDIEKRFLYFVFQENEHEFIENSSGTTVKGIKLEYLLNYLIPLPPLAEQKRIVAKIESLFSALDKIQAAAE